MIKTQSTNTRRARIALVALSGITLAMTLAPSRAQADEKDKLTFFTVTEPMQIRDTYLAPGRYVLKLHIGADPDRHIVQIYNGDQTRLINTVFAIRDVRTRRTSQTSFVMWETPQGSAKALKAWFYPGDYEGQEFPYPKHLQQIAFNQSASSTPAPQPAPAATPEPAAESQALATPPPSEQSPEIAQNSPPPTPPAVEPPAVSSAPAVLPQTASPYPLFGFAGLFLLGLGGLLRQARSA